MKVKKTYRLEQETIEELEKLCSDSGKSATEVIEGAIHDAIHVPDVERIGDGWAQTVAALTDQLAVKDDQIASLGRALEAAQETAKAAQALQLSQPSVSLALRELEDYYGVTLFERVGRRISPTECGREFYGYAVHVVSLMDELETRMRNWDAIGTVRIGATVTIGTYLLPELVRRYQAEFPALHVDVQVCRASQVEQLVLDNRIDLGLIETQPEHEELVAVPFSRDELQAIVPPDSPLAGRGKVTIQELAQFPFLMREPGSAGRKALDGYLALHRLSVQPAWESVSTQALIKAVVEGLGVAVLPKLLIQQDVASGNVVPLRRTLNIVYHKRKYLSESMQRFVALCRETGEQ